MASQTCHLLALPKELRLEIYEYLFRPTDIFIAGSSKDVATGPRFQVAVADEGIDLNILRTCQMICEEATPVLSKFSHLSLRPSARSSSHGDFQDISWLAHVVQLDMLEVRLSSLPSTMKGDLTRSKFFSDLLLQDLRLNAVRIILQDRIPTVRELDNGEKDFTSLAHMQRLLKVWHWLRPTQRFEFEIIIQGEDEITYQGRWDVSERSAGWDVGWKTCDEDWAWCISDAVDLVRMSVNVKVQMAIAWKKWHVISIRLLATGMLSTVLVAWSDSSGTEISTVH
ncbi:hypothetical protein PRZ48_002874 [Zasmidium cellare]|uniref:F-box domain-containing protein n=1 Tax=Zasmidium cellare TaxID=395010 RepID=A0ABR0EUP8_ZASCE|nr:hypothetical protein PRZ48_002874 [Zasmidium cellare]